MTRVRRWLAAIALIAVPAIGLDVAVAGAEEWACVAVDNVTGVCVGNPLPEDLPLP